MARVVVQVVPEAVQPLRRNDSHSPEIRELARLLSEFHATLRPTHSESRDPDLSTWFETDAPDASTAEHIASMLNRNDAVQAAYVKPPEEAPRD